VTGPDYLAARRALEAWSRRFAAWWDSGWDLLVMPVLNGVPPPLGWVSDPVDGLTRLLPLVQYTAQANVSGQPAISLPLHWSAQGLPVGVQLVAAFGREDLLLRVAAQLEQAAPWAQRRPPVSA
jgi:amidase